MTLQETTDLRLSGVLDGQILAAEAMLGTLDSEHHALLDNDADALSTACTEKLRLLEVLEGLERQRHGLAGDAAVRDARWERLLDLMEECRRRNQSNGALVRVRREQLLEVLTIVRGSEPELYDATGTEPGRAATTTLGSA